MILTKHEKFLTVGSQTLKNTAINAARNLSIGTLSIGSMLLLYSFATTHFENTISPNSQYISQSSHVKHTINDISYTLSGHALLGENEDYRFNAMKRILLKNSGALDEQKEKTIILNLEKAKKLGLFKKENEPLLKKELDLLTKENQKILDFANFTTNFGKQNNPTNALDENHYDKVKTIEALNKKIDSSHETIEKHRKKYEEKKPQPIMVNLMQK